MWLEKRIAVVVPAYREERLIGRTLAGIPAWVDAIYVVDDASPDATADAARAGSDPRLRVLRHAENRGVGAAIVTGYQRARAEGAEVVAVMAGDNQMHPDDLEAVVTPVAEQRADYVKGNRFVHAQRTRMPRLRRLGGTALGSLTRLCTGLSVSDTQCGFTAISASAIERLPLAELWPRYGYPNDLLGMLAARGLSVVEVPVRPVYAGEYSGIRAWHLLTVAGVIARRWRKEQRGSGAARASSVTRHPASAA
ncbi:MAG TPA: glycosyltransferase family 2 protein [Polyangiaceae bacterium]